jgi:hypothetical protein
MSPSCGLPAAVLAAIVGLSCCVPASAQKLPGDPAQCEDDASPGSSAAGEPQQREACEAGSIAGAVGCVSKQMRGGAGSSVGTKVAPPPAPGARPCRSLQDAVNEAGNDIKKTTVPECSGITLQYSPSTIRYLTGAFPVWSYTPADCQKPAQQQFASFRFVATSGVEFQFGFPDQRYVVAKENKAGEATLEATVGTFKATATVTVLESPKCTEMRVRLNHERIHVGDESFANVSFLPDDCPHDYSGIQYSSTAPDIASLRPNQQTIFGRAAGETIIRATNKSFDAIARLVVVNDGDDCAELRPYYTVGAGLRLGGKTKIKEEMGYSPTLDYLPRGCRRPDGKPRFEEVTAGLVFTDAATGVLTGRRVGQARIAAIHGPLRGITPVDVVAVPNCSSVYLSYTRNPLPIGATDAPTLEYRKFEHGDNEEINCHAPDGTLLYSSDHPEVVSVAGNGTITAQAPGEATISVKAGELEGRYSVEVVAH